MVKRITATRDVLSLSVTGLQFVAGVRFLLGMFDSDVTARKLWESAYGTYGQMYGTLFASGHGTMASGPPTALLPILGFMGFGYVMFTAVPGASVKMDRRRQALDEES